MTWSRSDPDTSAGQEESGYTLSEYERLALSHRINLSDGHARSTLSARQRAIFAGTLELLDACSVRPQKDIEDEFLDRFFDCAAQKIHRSKAKTFLTFSSSSAIKIAAQYCRLRGLSVYLIEPCFDNIVHLLKTEGVPVTAVRESDIHEFDELGSKLNLGPKNAIWLVQPNNPTGFCMDKRTFRHLISHVAERKSTIILDFCFRFYAEQLKEWDQYAALTDAKATYLCFEDTGKTWSLADTKVGITVASMDAAPIIYRLHDQLVLNISPLHLTQLTEFLKDTLTHGFYETIRCPIEDNRRLVHALVQRNLVLHATSSCQNVPMELLRLPHEMRATEFWLELHRCGVDILPARNYFWSSPDMGTTLFRLPLARPRSEFDLALSIIEKSLLALRIK